MKVMIVEDEEGIRKLQKMNHFRLLQNVQVFMML